MITEIRLVNYKAFRCERIKLEPITVFIGPNGSGKSTIASALYSIASLARFGLAAAFPENSFFDYQHFDPISCRYEKAPIGLGFSGILETISTDFDYDIFFHRNEASPSGFHISYEGIRVINERYGEFLFSTGQAPAMDFDLPTSHAIKWVPGMESNPEHRDSIFLEREKADKTVHNFFKLPLLRIINQFLRTSRYQFQASAVRTPSDFLGQSQDQPILKADGSNLTDLLRHLYEEERGRFQDVKKWVREYAKGGNSIVDIGIATQGDKIFLNFFEENLHRKSFAIKGPFVSDGYWIFLAFATLANSPYLPPIAFFEEPESHLHPHRLSVLYDLFKEMSSRPVGPCQVLISTHSPYFLDYFKEHPESVVLIKNGQTKKVTELPNHEKLLAMYSLGELWFSNLFDWGNPS